MAKNFETAPPPAGAVGKAKQAAESVLGEIRQAEEKIVDSVSSALRAGGLEESAALRTAQSKASALTKLRVELGNRAREARMVSLIGRLAKDTSLTGAATETSKIVTVQHRKCEQPRRVGHVARIGAARRGHPRSPDGLV